MIPTQPPRNVTPMGTLEALTHARSLGLSPSAFHALLVLLDDSPIRPTEVAKRTGTSTANVTNMIDRLEKGGWAERHDHFDRRSQYLMPTQKAFDAFHRCIEGKMPEPAHLGDGE
jgi:DNA-binding MarR family transcriptional regulator